MKTHTDVILNIAIIIFGLIGFYTQTVDLIYYTADSNLFLMASCVIYLIFRNSYITDLIKYSATLSVTITLLMVIFVLMPLYDFNYHRLILDGGTFYHHILCPLLAIISFVFFENNSIENNLKNNLRAVYFTIIYAVILLILNIERIVVGPYPFLEVYNQSPLMTFVWIIVILGGALVLSRILLYIRRC